MAPKKFKIQSGHKSSEQEAAPASRSLFSGKSDSFLRLSLPSSSAALTSTPSSSNVSPLVLLSILDHYLRRKESQSQIIGALLGVRTTDSFGMSQVQVVNSFPLSYSETSDHKVFVDADFFTKMYALHLQTNPKETIIGWYATGNELNENSVWIQEMFSGENSSSFSAYDAGSKKPGSFFVQLPVSYQSTDKSSMDVLVKATESLSMEASLTSDLDNLEESVKSVYDMLTVVCAYVEKILSGETKPNATLGRHLLDTVSLIPQIKPAEFSKVFNSHMQDILMVVYLANLTRTQLAIAERLHKMV
ncbi:hypothetical protein BATDEDRAFT_35451 [Batrachochytrium dendrobatidis JAM81]|uniref:MPN domain-containing protein n=1 Tax=Batrachochytrium dendrobatidis (strain JAM81 / FGSC 10211) TaxID=684364 RepID=F4P678_BATDJ|nr:uncharacterized protein BATDEDRAFT_35451 [Batrachochytrium dendrobatidis JAM81]EGF79558.1 hypothetical protein BATDEDRAFT_35451 [Batrachochytrium dendrobatidis JAM81]|eukprot:XP_006680007.1 hypothetical protein BATDEDRAFT_35451 [Batrachochytrium dendrobatidis JAM81]